jgi:hypothetical protein
VARSASDALGRAAAPDTHSLDRTERLRPEVAGAAFGHGRPGVVHLALPTGAPRVHHGTVRARGLPGPLAASLVELLRAPALGHALEIESGLLDECPADDPQRPWVERVLSLALGREVLPGRWTDDPVADWLRARLLEAPAFQEAEPGWLGILAWLGRHLDVWYRSPSTLAEMPLAAAALTVRSGAAHALSTVSSTLREARLTRDWAGLLRVLILRCALDGAFVPEALRKVVPSPRRGGDVVAPAWKPLVLARRALVESGHVVGAAHLTAALVATDVRRGLMGDLRFLNLHARIPSWGSRALTEKESQDLHVAIHGRDARGSAFLSRLPSTPWPHDWGGPDTREITVALARLLGSEPGLAREVFLHDGLALAAIHALGGHAVNALAALGATRTPPAFDEARTALARAIHTGIGATRLPGERPVRAEAEAVYRQLRRLPEPNLALETPYWLLGAQRAQAQHALQTSGRLQAFRDLRLVLDRPDVAEALAPFWLLREAHGFEASLGALVRRTAARIGPPTPDQCLRFLGSLE